MGLSKPVWSSIALVPLSLAVASSSLAQEGQPRFMKIEKGKFLRALEKDGLFVPSEPAELKFWPEGYSDALQVVEVLPSGSTVQSGDVVLRIDTRRIDEQIRNGELDVRSAEQRLKDLEEEMSLLGSEMQADLARSEKELELAEKRLRGFKDFELALSADEAALWQSRSEHGIEDQKDELSQLGKMYSEDELTDETEESVLKRQKRDLESSKLGLGLQRRRRTFAVDFEQPMRLESMILEVSERTRGLDRLRRTVDSRSITKEIEIARARLEHERSRDTLARLKRDREQFTLRAPSAGIVYHGGVDPADAKTWKKGGNVVPYEVLLTIAPAGKVKARVPVGEADVLKLEAGMAASVKPLALGDVTIRGKLDPIDRLPAVRGSENQWNVGVTLADSDSRVVPSMRCKVEIVLEELPDVLTVPASAVFEKGGEKTCYVQKGETAEPRRVVLGATDGKRYVVNEGLAAGETVLLVDPTVK